MSSGSRDGLDAEGMSSTRLIVGLVLGALLIGSLVLFYAPPLR